MRSNSVIISRISKNVNFVVLNSMQNKGTCFGSDQNKITIVEHNKITDFEIKNKQEVAYDIIDHLEKNYL